MLSPKPFPDQGGGSSGNCALLHIGTVGTVLLDLRDIWLSSKPPAWRHRPWRPPWDNKYVPTLGPHMELQRQVFCHLLHATTHPSIRGTHRLISYPWCLRLSPCLLGLQMGKNLLPHPSKNAACKKCIHKRTFCNQHAIVRTTVNDKWVLCQQCSCDPWIYKQVRTESTYCGGIRIPTQ